ncbi:MAG TPA: DUF2332 domain-containing protein [Rhodopila sp.]
MADSRASETSARYMRFAEVEARGRSPLYEALTRAAAGDDDVVAFLMTLPREKRQPNLLLAAMRHLFGVPVDWSRFRRDLLDHAEAVRAVMLARSTQTNEPARCATLLPVLARLPQPLALLEVGASAGLCLLPDCYGYDYGSRSLRPVTTSVLSEPQLEGAEAAYPIFSCAASGSTPLPVAVPRIVWRAGLDLNPLDAADPSQAAWLETLVWPEQSDRLRHLRSALRVAAAYAPRIVRGDLLHGDLERLCSEAPKDATLVIFHTAVLAYVSGRAERQDFADRAGSLCDYWICNESPHVLGAAGSDGATADRSGWFLLSVNGTAVAWTDPHGGAIDWITDNG